MNNELLRRPRRVGQVAQPKARYFDRHRRFKWHAAWTIDAAARTAVHASGVVYDFAPGKGGDSLVPHGHACQSGAWHGKLRATSASRLSSSSARAHRICLEACQLFDESASHHCQDCSRDTRGGDYYMVNDDLWAEAHPQDVGMLCMSCLETRIGRPLDARDFTHFPVNAMNEKVRAIRRRDLGDSSPTAASDGAGGRSCVPGAGTGEIIAAFAPDMRDASSARRKETVANSLAENASSLAAAFEAPSLSLGFTALFSRHRDTGGVDL